MQLLLAVMAIGFAWGPKGHSMTGRVAVRALPKEMPAFFRKAEIELGYLCPEPDRWRNAEREPSLKGSTDRDHSVKLETLPDPLPTNRYDYLLEMLKRQKPDGKPTTVKDVHFAPYAMAEHLDMMTVNFMIWRKAESRTDEQRRIKRQVEQNIIHTAGLLSHFVTDTGQPLHNSVHTNGWLSGYANPNGYEGKTIHGRFEHDYVINNIEESDFDKRVPPVRERTGPWLDEAVAHMRDAHRYLERVYQLDLIAPWAKGSETADHKTFTSERLAYSAQALRDFWYSAWVRSANLPEHNSLTQYTPKHTTKLPARKR